MSSSKIHTLKKQTQSLSDRPPVESPETTPIYNAMAHSNKTPQELNPHDRPNDANEHLQRARGSLEKLVETNSSKTPPHYTQAQNDIQAPSPLTRTQSDEIPRRKGSIATTRRKDINLSKKNEEYERLNDELRRTQIELYNAVEQLGLLHSSDPFREGDDRIVRKMDELRSDIRQWSLNFYQESKKSGFERFLNSLRGTAEEESPFKEVTVDYAAYLKDGRGPTLLVQGLIWQILMTAVFDRFLWLGGPCQSTTRPANSRQPQAPPKRDCLIVESFQFLVQSGQNSMKNEMLSRTYHHWRAHAARLFVNSPDHHQECVKQNAVAMTKLISSKLKNYTSKKDGLGNGQPSRATENLTAIVRSAIAFDQALWQQKASFHFRTSYSTMSKGGAKTYKFDPYWMISGLSEAHDAVLIGQGNTVKLFSVPALLKQGTSEGENYSHDVVLCKAHVDCLIGGA